MLEMTLFDFCAPIAIVDVIHNMSKVFLSSDYELQEVSLLVRLPNKISHPKFPNEIDLPNGRSCLQFVVSMEIKKNSLLNWFGKA